MNLIELTDSCVFRTDELSSENQSLTTTSSTISELPTTPPDDTQTTLVQSSDDENWPPPPSPISEACTTATTAATAGGEELPETAGSSSSPVMRFTFTVKLDSQLLKRRRQQASDQAAAASAQLTVDDVADANDDQTPCASPPETRASSSKPRPPEMAVVIPDVVVCADAQDAKKLGAGSNHRQQQPHHHSVQHVVLSSTSETVERQQQRSCIASRSCQTELRDVPAAPQIQMCSCSCPKTSRTPAAAAAAESRDEVDRRGGGLDNEDADDDQLSCRCISVLDDVADDDDGDGDLWAQPEVERTGVRVDDGSYLRPLVTRVYPADGRDVANRGGALPDGELTHMSWSEVLKEAQTMGIPLHLPTTSVTGERQRHPSCSASSTVTSASATPVKRHPDKDEHCRRSTKPANDSSGNKKVASSSSSSSGIKTSFRDLFRLFGRKKSSSNSAAGGNNNNNNRVRRSKSMEPPQHRVQGRNLPTPPNNRLHQHQHQHHHHHQRELSTGSDTDRTRHWVSRSGRMSASSCPPTSATLQTGSTLHCRRSTSGGASLASSSSRQAVDYCPGSSWAGSSCGGSLPAYRHRCTPAAPVDVVDHEMVVAVDDVFCGSPSMSSFSSVCSASRTAPWRTHHAAPTTPNSIANSSLASPGLSLYAILFAASLVIFQRQNSRNHVLYKNAKLL